MLCTDPSAVVFMLRVRPRCSQAPIMQSEPLGYNGAGVGQRLRGCLMWAGGEPSGLLRRAMQLRNVLTHHLADIHHMSANSCPIWRKREGKETCFSFFFSSLTDLVVQSECGYFIQ